MADCETAWRHRLYAAAAEADHSRASEDRESSYRRPPSVNANMRVVVGQFAPSAGSGTGAVDG